jgi:hypothetical protein
MKLAAKIVAGLAVLGLSAPAFAADTAAQATPVVKSQPKHRVHRKVAQTEKKADEKKVEKKHEHAQKAAPKAEAPAKPAETAPSAPAAPAK